MKSPIIIIGMHRSGTSLVAETLNKAGIYMGAFRDHNGEAFHFLSLNQLMMEAAGGSWLQPVIPEKEHDKTLDAKTLFAEHIKASSGARSMRYGSMDWGWKDPRNTFTLSLWLNRFPDAKVIHVIRDGRSVALSLKNRNKTIGEVQTQELSDLAFNFQLWEKYVTQGQTFRTLGIQYHEIKYEELMQGEAKSIQSLESFVQRSLVPFLVINDRPQKPFPHELNDLASQSKVFKKLGYTL